MGKIERLFSSISSIKEYLREEKLARKSRAWGMELYERKVEEGLSPQEVHEQVCRGVEEEGLLEVEINAGYFEGVYELEDQMARFSGEDGKRLG